MGGGGLCNVKYTAPLGLFVSESFYLIFYANIVINNSLIYRLRGNDNFLGRKL